MISPGGIVETHNAQRIVYRETEKAECLVDICRALERLHRQVNVTTVRLGPADVAEEIAEFLDSPDFSSRFQILRGDTQLTAVSMPVLISGIFKNEDFGYRTITVERPERDASGEIVKATKGKLKGTPQANANIRDTENVPLNEDAEEYWSAFG